MTQLDEEIARLKSELNESKRLLEIETRERKRLEKEFRDCAPLIQLQYSDARFRAIFENAGIGIGLVGLDRHPMDVNTVFLEITGYTAEELSRISLADLSYPDDADLGTQELKDVLDGKRNSFQVEKRFVRKNGEVYWVRLTKSVVRAPGGEPQYFIAILEDIDEQKKAAEELYNSQARFRAIFENAAIGISLIAPDGHVLAVNPVLVRLSGRSESELLTRGGQEITYREDRDVGRQEFSEVFSGKRDSYQVEKRYVHKDGQIQWMRQSVSAVRDENGKTLYLIVLAEDIDEGKRAVEKLRESEARFRAMFENAAVGMAVMSLDLQILQVNQTGVRLTGYSPEETKGRNPSWLMSAEEDRNIGLDLYRELVEGKRKQYTIEKRFIRKDGETFWARVNSSAVCDANGQPLYTIAIMEDITAEKRAAERLAAQEAEYRRNLEQRIVERTEELNRANELLQQKAAQEAVSTERTRLARDLHDAVTQTLFSASLIAEVLPDLWDMNQAEGRKRLEELRQLTRGALAEMRTLLVELRPNALIEIPLPDLLRQLCESLIGRARLPIELNVEGKRKLPPDVQVGLYRITQEALNNVVKHAKATQAVVTLRLDKTVQLSIADNGCGFDPASVPPDHLGVKIMRERAEVIGATMSIYSEPGEGTQISLNLS